MIPALFALLGGLGVADATLEGKLEVLERILPAQPGTEQAADDVERRLARMARLVGLRLAGFEARSSSANAHMGLATSLLDIGAAFRTGLGVDAERQAHGHRLWPLVRTLCDMTRAARITSVAFSPEGRDGVRMNVSLRLYHRPPDGLAGQKLLEAKVAAIEELRRAQFWPLARLAAIAGATAEHPAFVSELVLREDGIEVQGFVRWPASALAWKPGRDLDRVFVSTRREGLCERFRHESRVRGVPPDLGEEPPAPDRHLRFLLPAGVSRLCEPAPRSDRRLPPLKLSGTGPLSLDGPELDLHDLVLILHRQAGQYVIVNDAVGGRLDVSLSGVTLEQALAALAPFGVSASPPAPIRVVTGAPAATLPSAPRFGTEPPLSLHLSRAKASAVLHLAQDISDDRVLVPSGPLPRVSGFVEERPWDEVIAATAAAVGLRMRREAGFILFEGDDRKALEAADPGDDLRRGAYGTLADLPCDRVELAAIGSQDGVYTAWVEGAGGSLVPMRKADRCWDGQVTAIDAERLELETQVSDPLSPVKTRQRVLKLRDR
jgi:hypothetical protein